MEKGRDRGEIAGGCVKPIGRWLRNAEGVVAEPAWRHHGGSCLMVCGLDSTTDLI